MPCRSDDHGPHRLNSDASPLAHRDTLSRVHPHSLMVLPRISTLLESITNTKRRYRLQMCTKRWRDECEIGLPQIGSDGTRDHSSRRGKTR